MKREDTYAYTLANGLRGEIVHVRFRSSEINFTGRESINDWTYKMSTHFVVVLHWHNSIGAVIAVLMLLDLLTT